MFLRGDSRSAFAEGCCKQRRATASGGLKLCSRVVLRQLLQDAQRDLGRVAADAAAGAGVREGAARGGLRQSMQERARHRAASRGLARAAGGGGWRGCGCAARPCVHACRPCCGAEAGGDAAAGAHRCCTRSRARAPAHHPAAPHRPAHLYSASTVVPRATQAYSSFCGRPAMAAAGPRAWQVAPGRPAVLAWRCRRFSDVLITPTIKTIDAHTTRKRI